MNIWKYISIGILLTVIGTVMFWILMYPEPFSEENETKVLVQEHISLTKVSSEKKELGFPNKLKDNPISNVNDSLLKKSKDSKSTSLTQAEKIILRTWLFNETSVEKAKEVGFICLKHNLSDKNILELIGEPLHRFGTNSIAYSFAPSQLLELYLDQDGIVIDVKITGDSIIENITSDKGEGD